jgi:hypothetical protein
MTLAGELDVSVGDDAVTFTYAVTNEGSEAVDLNFSDSQRADVVVSQDGEPVWRWSDGQMFMQMLGSETIDAGATSEHEFAWEHPAPGEYEAEAELVANEATAPASASFSV